MEHISTNVKSVTDIELSWAAGFFEGEGSVRINKPTKRNMGHLVASTVNTDRQAMDWFQERWPGYMKPATGLGPNRKPAWVWTLAARKAAAFLTQIRPFIVRDQVEEKIAHGLQFQDGKRTGRESRTYEYAEEQWNAYWWMGVLNARGVQQ